MYTADLFNENSFNGQHETLGACARLLRGCALPYVDKLLLAIDTVTAQAAFRYMVTPGGFSMSAAMTNCGRLGWVSDRCGYRYTGIDPVSGCPWPAMPVIFTHLASQAAEMAGFSPFSPDSCLINRYQPGARLSLHQDRNERDFNFPIVSVSLGLSALFLFGGNQRSDAVVKIPLFHGDVVVWGGVDRLRYHGIAALKKGQHGLLGSQRINFTLRKAG